MPSQNRLPSHHSQEMSGCQSDLEYRQSQFEVKHRSASIGNDAELTELAAPKPAPETETGDNLEKEESKERQSQDREKSFADDGALAEVAAPELVEHDSSRDASPSRYGQNSLVSGTDKEEAQMDAESAIASKKQSFWNETVIVSWLIFFSLLGTLARLGVEAVATYPYSPFPSTVLWANLGGSFFIGFLLEDRRLFRYTVEPDLITDDSNATHRHIDKSKKTLPLYIGLATGFCGSFTSFSTYITDAFLAMSNALPPPSSTSPYHSIDPTHIRSRNAGYSFMAVLAVLLIHPAVSIGALKTGAHLAVGMENITPSLPSRFIRRVLDPLAIPLGVGCWIGAIVLTVWPPASDWPRRVTMALVFAPIGVLLRFYASRTLNARVPRFPLGTFAANVFGTCVEGMCYDLQHTYSIIGMVSSGRVSSCAVFEGVMQGFCGCTTTVSTWVVELNGLRRSHAWLYGSASVGIAFGFQVIIMGSIAWTTGFEQSCGQRI